MNLRIAKRAAAAVGLSLMLTIAGCGGADNRPVEMRLIQRIPQGMRQAAEER